MDSPNLESLDRWSFDVRQVDKPWGYELIWAVTDVYVGKVLFVRAGESLSLQFHRVKDEAWYVQSGRAMIELGKKQSFFGLRFEGESYDCGSKIGFLTANVAYALARPDIAPEFRQEAKRLLSE